MGPRYWRFGAVALGAVLIIVTGGVGAVLAADPPGLVMDGVVTVHWVDPTDGPMDGAVIRIFYYRVGDPFPGILPGIPTTAANGVVVIGGVPRAEAGTEPVLLDIRGDRQTSTIDNEGCTSFGDWVGTSNGIASGLAEDVELDTVSTHVTLICPDPQPSAEPTATPTAAPTPTEEPAPTVAPTPRPRIRPIVPPGPIVPPTPRPRVRATPSPTAAVVGTGEVRGAVGQSRISPPRAEAPAARASVIDSSFAAVLGPFAAVTLVAIDAVVRFLARFMRS